MLLILKLVLVPALVVAVTLATRWWGPRVGGWLTGMPIVAGPALFFLALEQGDAFASEAARATLVALIGVAAFGVVYAWVALRSAWPVSLLAGWAAFGALTPLLHAVAWPPAVALGGALGSIAVAQRWLLPPPRGPATQSASPAWDLPLRVTGALAIVLTVTHLADRLGPSLSGALTPFPVALAVVLVFAHARDGTPMVSHLLRSFIPAMWAFALFCYVLSVTMVPLGHAGAFAVAVVVQLVAQGAVFWIDGRATVPAATAR
jgi:hypothetical protein